MKNAKNTIIGLIVILIGVLLLLKSLGIIENLNIFFKGWWTLFIIIPSAIGLINDDDKTGNIIGLFIGILLLLGVRDVISFDLIWKIFFPVIIIIIGLSMVFKDFFTQNIRKEITKINASDLENYTAIFAAQKFNLANQKFTGGDINAIFGGIDLDLRETKLKENTVIKICAVFGGVDIFVPQNVNVKVVSHAIFGGVDDKRRNLKEDSKDTIYIDATCIFGGVEIK